MGDPEVNDGSTAPEPLSLELRERLTSHDEEALARFFDVYFERVYGYVRRLVGDEHLAEDLTQDVFLHVHRALPTYDPSRELRPWLFTIATNKVRDHWRTRAHREGRREPGFDEGVLGEIPAADGRPDRNLTEREAGEALRRAVDGLPDGMRMTVLLRVYEGLSFEAIGGILDRSEVAVRKRYSRALEALRGVLEPPESIHTEEPP